MAVRIHGDESCQHAGLDMQQRASVEKVWRVLIDAMQCMVELQGLSKKGTLFHCFETWHFFCVPTMPAQCCMSSLSLLLMLIPPLNTWTRSQQVPLNNTCPLCERVHVWMHAYVRHRDPQSNVNTSERSFLCSPTFKTNHCLSHYLSM